eukprot:gene4118-5871_t
MDIRGIFWLFTSTAMSEWTSSYFYILYWMPTPLEFGSFMLLPLYFSSILHKNSFTFYYENVIKPVYIFLIIGLILFQAIWAILSAIENQECDDSVQKCFHTEFSSKAFRTITAACFLFLAAMQGYYAVQLHYMDKSRYQMVFITSPVVLDVVNAVLVVSFASRSLYQILAIFECYILPNIPLQGDGDVPFVIFLFFELWDYLPTILLIMTISSRSVEACRIMEAYCHYFNRMSRMM